MQLGSRQLSEQSLVRLQGMARARGLPEENIKLHPIALETGTRIPSYVWFDQVIEPTEFEEIFRWSFAKEREEERNFTVRTTWSDLISFWGAESEAAWGLEVETRIGTDARRWYLVVVNSGEEVRVLYQGSV